MVRAPISLLPAPAPRPSHLALHTSRLLPPHRCPPQTAREGSGRIKLLPATAGTVSTSLVPTLRPVPPSPQGSSPHAVPEPVGQSWLLQERKRVRRPSQYLPPFRGVGRVQSREEKWTPPPQLREQAPHGPQGPQPPACGTCRSTEWKGGVHALSPGLRAHPHSPGSTPILGSYLEVLQLVHVEAAAPHAGL